MKNLELIDKYFENTLTPREQLLFNELLQNNEEFRAEFVFQKDLKKVIHNHQNEQLKNTLKEIEQETSERRKLPRIPRKWLAAAGFALLFTFGGISVKDHYWPSDDLIYSSYFAPYPNTAVPITRGDDLISIEYRAFLAYEAEEYHKALNLFNSVENKNDEYIRFYQAMCLMSVEKYEQAVETLIPLVNTSSMELSDLEWKQKAQWYAALAHLKLGNEMEARNYFLELKDQEDEFHFKKEEAGEILQRLN